ncbi:ATP-dependent DNA helicase RecG [Pirellulimonas nuda]|uniref:ATP-dependent DNA helicase RecG n=1 Tax=Pirellulimonas nuda TaxID=2528009 RepID=A0A518D9D3_9BACT|nr:ATP-dependent DNA helicase RecG [Pirellulimonas nuda]QDU88091.1 ATP-dependent DNA helicase RecG [Pirellulimonas nuda]
MDDAPVENASPEQLLATPIAKLRGSTPARASRVRKLGLRTARDLLFFFPRDYEDISDLRTIDQLEEDALVTVRGVIEEVDSSSSGFGRSRVGIIVADGTGHARGTWFNQPFMRDKFASGQRVQLSGKAKLRGGRYEFSHPRVAWLEADEAAPATPLLPVYGLTDGITQYHMRKLVETAVEDFATAPPEVFSQALLEEHALLPIARALPLIHGPHDEKEKEAARRRFVFQELFVLQLALAARRYQQRVGFRAIELPTTAQVDARILRLLPFELTAGQRAAIEQVSRDIAESTPMNRLLQGDVGSGKTVVALYALLVAVAGGAQAALMAPTEILARQHALTLAGLLKQSRVNFRLLVGGQNEAERSEVLTGIASGDVNLVIGTHALLSEGVEFKRLGLAVIDEQHKFGVRQRAALRRGDSSPHYLVMTATPIPRTISMTQFGDLDVSILRDMPPGRQPVTTYLVAPEQRPRWWKFVRDRLHEGRQAYFVAPLVDGSDTVAAVSASQAFESLTNGELAEFRVDILHGRMTPADKDDAMARFRAGQTQVLVSTTVIEVGVDVANASVMMIASPDRFGLSQLHQLRGRVGRGGFPGFCGCLAEEELTDAARKRLEAFAATNDGFELAELDFKLRGPGDLFGAKQSGLPPLMIADLARDRETLEEARQAAHALFAADPGLKNPEHVLLRKQMLTRYGAALELGDVG